MTVDWSASANTPFNLVHQAAAFRRSTIGIRTSIFTTYEIISEKNAVRSLYHITSLLAMPLHGNTFPLIAQPPMISPLVATLQRKLHESFS